MKLTKKVIGCICALSMLSAPISIFASTNTAQKTSIESYSAVVTLEPGESFQKEVTIHSGSARTFAAVLLSGPPAGWIYFQLLDSNGKSVVSTSNYGRNAFMDLPDLEDGTYTLWVMNGNTEDPMYIYDMYIQ